MRESIILLLNIVSSKRSLIYSDIGALESICTYYSALIIPSALIRGFLKPFKAIWYVDLSGQLPGFHQILILPRSISNVDSSVSIMNGNSEYFMFI